MFVEMTRILLLARSEPNLAIRESLKMTADLCIKIGGRIGDGARRTSEQSAE